MRAVLKPLFKLLSLLLTPSRLPPSLVVSLVVEIFACVPVLSMDGVRVGVGVGGRVGGGARVYVYLL